MNAAPSSPRPGPGVPPRSGADDTGDGVGDGAVTVRYWAAARAAAQVETETVRVPIRGATIADLAAAVTSRHTGLARVMAVASVLVDGRAVPRGTWAERVVAPGEVVEILPPFAGG